MPARHFQPYEHTDSGVLAYRRGLGLGAEWHPACHPGAGSGCRVHIRDAAEHIQAVAYVLQPAARLSTSRVQTAAVVAHFETEPPVFAPHSDRSSCGPRVLGQVLKGFGAAEVDRAFELSGITLGSTLDIDADRNLTRTRAKSRLQPFRFKERWIDSAGKVPQRIDGIS